jgi:hypothetical protein
MKYTWFLFSKASKQASGPTQARYLTGTGVTEETQHVIEI